MEEKKCPVDRVKLLIGLQCCKFASCNYCPYSHGECELQANDAMAYIAFLEERLGVTG